MKLTAAQEKIVSDYLHAITVELDSLGEDARRSALMRARSRIREELRLQGSGEITDKDLRQVLDVCGKPSQYAERLIDGVKSETRNGGTRSNGREQSGETLPWSLDTSDAKFLGVCAGVARELELAPKAVRGFALVLLVTGPFALLAYLGAYAFMYYRSDPNAVPAIDLGRLGKCVAAAFFITLAIHLAAVFALRGIGWLYMQYLGQSFAGVSFEYAWLPGKLFGYFFWALMWSVPLAALAGLPVSKGWSGTLNKLSQTCIAIYAVALAYGFAALLVGIALVESKNLNGIDPAALLSEYLYP